MCRWITLLSKYEVALADIILTPSNSLIQLSIDASFHPGNTSINNHVMNGDGFGYVGEGLRLSDNFGDSLYQSLTRSTHRTVSFFLLFLALDGTITLPPRPFLPPTGTIRLSPRQNPHMPRSSRTRSRPGTTSIFERFVCRLAVTALSHT